MCETMAVRRKDNKKIKILCVDNFDPKRHELLDAPEDPKKMNKVELAAWLAASGIEVPEGANKADMIALIPE